MKLVVMCVISIILSIVFFVSGSIINNFVSSAIAIPLANIMINFCHIALLFPLFYSFIDDCIQNIKERKKGKKKKGKLYFKLIVSIIITFFAFYFTIGHCIFSFIDLFNGPSEVIIYDTKLIKEHSILTKTSYYLKGYTLEKEIKEIEIRHQEKEKFINAIEESYLLKVYYFEKTNIVYGIESIDIDDITNNYNE